MTDSTTVPTPTRWGPVDPTVHDDPFPTYEAARTAGPVHQVQLPDGHDAWVVLDYDAARRALKDPRLSKDMQTAPGTGPRRGRRRAPRTRVLAAHAQRRPT